MYIIFEACLNVKNQPKDILFIKIIIVYLNGSYEYFNLFCYMYFIFILKNVSYHFITIHPKANNKQLCDKIILIGEKYYILYAMDGKKKWEIFLYIYFNPFEILNNSLEWIIHSEVVQIYSNMHLHCQCNSYPRAILRIYSNPDLPYFKCT